MKIGVVLVTYNRIECLKKAIKSYENQSKKPSYIIVVNNNSNDGTKEFLDKWKMQSGEYDKNIINLEENIGGSGGFYTGLKKSLEYDVDWVWVSDDDAFPDTNAIQNIDNYLNGLTIEERDNVSAVCGTVINNGEIDLEHRRKMIFNRFTIEQRSVDKKEYSKESFDLDLFSYVGTVISKKKMVEVGLTEKDYFIYFDDTEHSYRLSKVGKIVCLPNVMIVHDAPQKGQNEISWKLFYSKRNRLLFYKKHFNRRYFNYLYFTTIAKCLIKKVFMINKKSTNLIISAVHAAKKDVKGIDKVYKPGWK